MGGSSKPHASHSPAHTLKRHNEAIQFQGYDSTIHVICPKGEPKKSAQTKIGNWRMRVFLRMRFQNFKSKCLQILFWLLLVTYPSISRKILMLFKCVEIGNESYMMWDTQIHCFTHVWWMNAVYAFLFAVVYIIGVPCLFYYLLSCMRNQYVENNAAEIMGNEKMKVKFLRLAKHDSELRGRFWKKIKNQKDMYNRIADFLRRLNLRDARNKARLGFLYNFYYEEYYWFELFEFTFKLCMTGLMVHIAPGTVSQILVGMLVTFCGFGLHMAAKPYKQQSNNILMIFGKFQLFLTLFGALLLKMETPFFTNDSQMRELDVTMLSNVIIYGALALLLVWVVTVSHDIYSHRRKLREAIEIRQKEIEGKRKFAALKNKFHLVEGVAHGHHPHPDDKKKNVVKITPISQMLKGNDKNGKSAMEKSKAFWESSESAEGNNNKEMKTK